MPAKKPSDFCKCDSNACGACACKKADRMCGPKCHQGKAWSTVPCLNTEHGTKVKNMKPAEIRKSLCDAGLSPIGDGGELKKRLAVYYVTMAPSAAGATSSDTSDAGVGGGEASETTAATTETASDSDTLRELMNVIMANEGDYPFILSLSGKMVTAASSKPELRKAYLLVSMKVHPDKNAGNPLATKAFQAVVESFERLANPEQFEEEEDDGKPMKKRQKTERFTRGNEGCHPTKVQCPKCRSVWNTRDLGLEDSAYNFLMQGIKQYICGGCFAKFGCMTALHTCPHCRKSFEYDPDDYHRKISCGNDKCQKQGRTFGFMMFKVSERREIEIRKEVKIENETLAKKRAQQRRRNQRFDKRTGPEVSNEDRVKEQLFLLKLADNCPRCGWELERGLKVEDAQAHLDGCTDDKEIAAYKKKLADEQKKDQKKAAKEESQEDMLAYKTWEHNGRQVGQLWMLSENTLAKECHRVDIKTEGMDKLEMIRQLGKVIRDRERKMLTMGDNADQRTSYDVTSIQHVDDEDLPSNMETMEKEELACVAASYGVEFDHRGDVKKDLLTKLERARFTGKGMLAICDITAEEKAKRKQKSSKKKQMKNKMKKAAAADDDSSDDDSDEDYCGEEIALSD